MGDVKFKIIGAVARSVKFDGIKYFWHEYLLYNPMVGFRWLVHSDNHWNFVEPVNPAEVTSTTLYQKVRQSVTTARTTRSFRTLRQRSNTSRVNSTGV